MLVTTPSLNPATLPSDECDVPNSIFCIVIIASVLGAGAGSGAFAQHGPPSGRETIIDVLSAQKDMMEQAGTREIFADVSSQSIQDSTTAEGQDLQDRRLWQRFAGSIPFESRTSVMTQNLRTCLSSC